MGAGMSPVARGRRAAPSPGGTGYPAPPGAGAGSRVSSPAGAADPTSSRGDTRSRLSPTPAKGSRSAAVSAGSRRRRNPAGIRRGGTIPADHAGSVLCRLLMDHPEVAGIELLGQSELIEGTITYSLGVFLPDGRELAIDVEDAAPRHRRRSS
jgi:hypothetical protein